MPEVAVSNEDGRYTVLSSDGIVAWRADEQSAIDALYEKYPDAPPVEIHTILQEECAPAAWRSAFATATAAEVEALNAAVADEESATAALYDRVERVSAAQSELKRQLDDLDRRAAQNDLQVAEDAFEAEAHRLAGVLMAEHGNFTEDAYRVIARSHLVDMNHHTYRRLMAAREALQ